MSLLRPVGHMISLGTETYNVKIHYGTVLLSFWHLTSLIPITQCDAENARCQVKGWHLKAFIMVILFKFVSSAAAAGHLIPASKG